MDIQHGYPFWISIWISTISISMHIQKGLWISMDIHGYPWYPKRQTPRWMLFWNVPRDFKWHLGRMFCISCHSVLGISRYISRYFLSPSAPRNTSSSFSPLTLAARSDTVLDKSSWLLGVIEIHISSLHCFPTRKLLCLKKTVEGTGPYFFFPTVFPQRIYIPIIGK